MDKRAILAGGLAQAVLFVLLLVAVRPPVFLYLLTPVVAGSVAVLLSERFEKEFLDAGGAGVVGTLSSLGAALVVVWTNTASLPLGYQLDLAFLTVALGGFVVIVSLPVALLVSVAAGQITLISWEGYVRGWLS